MEIERNNEIGYHMGVYICIGEHIHNLSHSDAIPFSQFGSFDKIHEYLKDHETLFIFLASGEHKIKKKAEQMACELALQVLEQNHSVNA